MELSIIRSEFSKAIIHYDKARAFQVYNEYISEKHADDFVDDVMVQVLDVIGTRWEQGFLSLSQVYLSSKICEDLMMNMIPDSVVIRKKSPRMAIVTLEDHHVLGKRIVKSTIRSRGFDLMDFGFGISAGEVLEKLKTDPQDILLVSVLMYPSALKVEKLREGFLKTGITAKILVGGAPFNMDRNLWSAVGADAMGATASEGCRCIENWLEGGLFK
jgi:methanogenic corrinoid protein MtbC1